MSHKIEISEGEVYNNLTVIEEIEPYVTPKGQRKRMVRCMCICGNETETQLNKLRGGYTKSCGCLIGKGFTKYTDEEWVSIINDYTNNNKSYTVMMEEYNISKRTCEKRLKGLKGESIPVKGTPTYNSYNAMKQRCLNENHHKYPRYGGRGISVCERWQNSYINFKEDMGERPEGMTLDRIDPDGNYEPGNVRWADPVTQSRNQSRHKGKVWDD